MAEPPVLPQQREAEPFAERDRFFCKQFRLFALARTRSYGRTALFSTDTCRRRALTVGSATSAGSAVAAASASMAAAKLLARIVSCQVLAAAAFAITAA